MLKTILTLVCLACEMLVAIRIPRVRILGRDSSKLLEGVPNCLIQEPQGMRPQVRCVSLNSQSCKSQRNAK